MSSFTVTQEQTQSVVVNSVGLLRNNVGKALVDVLYSSEEHIFDTLINELNEVENVSEVINNILALMTSERSRGPADTFCMLNESDFGVRILSPNVKLDIRKNTYSKKIVEYGENLLEHRLSKVSRIKKDIVVGLRALRQDIKSEYAEFGIDILKEPSADYLTRGFMPPIHSFRYEVERESEDKIKVKIITSVNVKGTIVYVPREVSKPEAVFNEAVYDPYISIKAKNEPFLTYIKIERISSEAFGKHSVAKINELLKGKIDSDMIKLAMLGNTFHVLISSFESMLEGSKIVAKIPLIINGAELAIVASLTSEKRNLEIKEGIEYVCDFIITVISINCDIPILKSTGAPVIPLVTDQSGSPIRLCTPYGQFETMEVRKLVADTNQYTGLNYEYQASFLGDMLVLNEDRFRRRLGLRNEDDFDYSQIAGIFHGGVEIPDVQLLIKKDKRLADTLINIMVSVISKKAGIDKLITMSFLGSILRSNVGVTIMENWKIRTLNTSDSIILPSDPDEKPVLLKDLVNDVITVEMYLLRMCLSMLFSVYTPKSAVNITSMIPVHTVSHSRLLRMAIPRCVGINYILIYPMTNAMLNLIVKMGENPEELKAQILSKDNSVRPINSTPLKGGVIQASLIEDPDPDSQYPNVLVEGKIVSVEDIIRQGIRVLAKAAIDTILSYVIWTPQFAIIFTMDTAAKVPKSEWYVHVISSTRPSRIVKPFNNLNDLIKMGQIHPGRYSLDYGYLNPYIYFKKDYTTI